MRKNIPKKFGQCSNLLYTLCAISDYFNDSANLSDQVVDVIIPTIQRPCEVIRQGITTLKPYIKDVAHYKHYVGALNDKTGREEDFISGTL